MHKEKVNFLQIYDMNVRTGKWIKILKSPSHRLSQYPHKNRFPYLMGNVLNATGRIDNL